MEQWRKHTITSSSFHKVWHELLFKIILWGIMGRKIYYNVILCLTVVYCMPCVSVNLGKYWQVFKSRELSHSCCDKKLYDIFCGHVKIWLFPFGAVHKFLKISKRLQQIVDLFHWTACVRPIIIYILNVPFLNFWIQIKILLKTFLFSMEIQTLCQSPTSDPLHYSGSPKNQLTRRLDCSC